MRNIFKRFFITSAAVSAIVGAAAIAFFAFTPNVPPAEEIQIARTPERIERGAYLFNHVTACVDCHSTRDWSRYSGPVTAGTEGKGGDRFGPEFGLPGTIYPRNITPAAIGDWSDGDLKRALTVGVSRDGSPLFPLMPFLAFRQMCEADLEAVIAYTRTLKPIQNDVPRSDIDFPVNLLIRTVPSAAVISADCPDPSDSVSYGKYLVTLSGCNDCHSQSDRGVPVAGMELAGGVTIPLPTGGTVTTANLTPDATGLGDWTRERFIGRFKSMDNEEASPAIARGDANTVMPWRIYAGMTERDLGAIYDYLRTVKPVENHVTKHSEPLADAR